MDVPAIEQINLRADPSAIEDWVERFELWCSINPKVKETNQSTYFLTAGGGELYTLMKNLAVPKSPATCKFEDLKLTLLKHVLPVNFQATERAKFNSMVRSSNTNFRDVFVQLQAQAMRCNFGDHLDEHLRDRLIAGVNNTEVQRRLLGNPTISFTEAKEVCEQHDDVHAATAQTTTVMLQKTKTKRIPSAVQQNVGSGKAANIHNSQKNVKYKECFSCGESHLRSTC